MSQETTGKIFTENNNNKMENSKIITDTDVTLGRVPKPNEWVGSIPAYVAGRHGMHVSVREADGKQAHATPTAAIVLSSNENPFGASPLVQARLKTLIELGSYNRYPDSNATALKTALASYYHIPIDNIVCGTGSDEILQSVAKGYLAHGKNAIYTQYGFLVYPMAIRGAGATAKIAAEKKLPSGNYSVDIDTIIPLVDKDTCVIYLANPANPTGSMIALAEIERLLKSLPEHTLLVVDAAYSEFAMDKNYEKQLFALVPHYPNLLVVKTFSKIYGLANLRVGFAYGHLGVIRVLNQLKNVFNVSTLGEQAGILALQDEVFKQQCIEINQSEKKRLQAQLRQYGFNCYDSETNFFLIDLKDRTSAQSVLKFLEQMQIFIRGLDAYGLPNCLRISIGKPEENSALLAALANWQKHNKA